MKVTKFVLEFDPDKKSDVELFEKFIAGSSLVQSTENLNMIIHKRDPLYDSLEGNDVENSGQKKFNFDDTFSEEISNEPTDIPTVKKPIVDVVEESQFSEACSNAKKQEIAPEEEPLKDNKFHIPVVTNRDTVRIIIEETRGSKIAGRLTSNFFNKIQRGFYGMENVIKEDPASWTRRTRDFRDTKVIEKVNNALSQLKALPVRMR